MFRLDRVDVRDMDDGFLAGIQHFMQRIKVTTSVEVVANTEGL